MDRDLEDELWNAGLEDRQFLTARIALSEEGLRRFPAEDELMTENRRRALAESYYELGETGKAESLYRRVSIALRHSQMEFTEFYSLRVC